MTILHVLDHSVPVASGYSFRSRNIVKFQQELGLRPVVLTSPRHGSAADGRDVIEGVPYYRTGAVRATNPLARDLRLLVRMAARIAAVARVEGATVLHAHSPLLNGLPALWAGRRLGLPVVYEARAFWEDAAVDHGTTTEGSLRYRLSRRLETVLFRRADRVVTICEGMRREIVLRGAAPERLTVVPNGVDVDWFQPRARDAALARRLGLGDGPVFGFAGSFYRYEGLAFLLDALPGLLAALGTARLLLVGSGEDEPALRARAEALDGAVVFAGQVAHDRVRDFCSVIDVFVCPRRRMRLTEQVTPLKPLEAMAMAKPVIASDVGGLQELIEHETTGLLFAAERPDALVDAALRVGRDADLRASIGAAARRYVARERPWPALVGRYARLYAELA